MTTIRYVCNSRPVSCPATMSCYHVLLSCPVVYKLCVLAIIVALHCNRMCGNISVYRGSSRVAVALKYTVHGVQSFIKGHRKSEVISIKHSITSPLTVE